MQPLGTALPSVPLAILRRTPVGFRSELVVVDVEGQRFLLGVTPHSIQSLATLDSDSASEAPAMAPAASVGDKFSAMLDSAERRSSARERNDPPASSVGQAAVPTVQDDADVAGQARGLLALRGRR
jgi:hypothetical protein